MRRSRARQALTGLAYGALLVWAYRAVVGVAWAYLGCPVGPWDGVGTGLGLALVTGIAWTLPVRVRRASAWWRLSTFLVLVAPAAVIPWQTGWWTLETGVVGLLGLGGAWALFHALPSYRGRGASALLPSGLTTWRPGRDLVLGALCLGAVGVALLLARLLGVPRQIPGLFAVYGQRATVQAAVQGAGGLMGYVIPWGLSVLAPGLLGWGLWRRSWGWTVVGCGFVVLLYSWTAQKSALLPILVLPLLLGWGRLRLWTTQRVLVSAMAAIILALAVDHWLLPAPLASSVVVRRAFVLPGLLFAQYGQFFGTHGFAWWTDSVLSWTGPYPFEHPRALLVGSAWVPQTRGTMWANASWWSDALSQGGLLGLWAIAFAGGLCRVLLDWTTRGRPAGIVLALVLLPLLAFTNSGFFVTLLTHGLLLGWGLALLVPTRRTVHAHR